MLVIDGKYNSEDGRNGSESSGGEASLIIGSHPKFSIA
jgi:hypothetical protein